MRQDEIVAALRREYGEMRRRWENGEFYYRLRFYTKHYAHKSWIRYAKMKNVVCAVLALSRMGIPITVPSVSAVLNGACSEQEAYQKLMYLASYNILEPISLLRSGCGRYLRGFKLSPRFVEAVYTPIIEMEGKLEVREVAGDNP